MEKCMATNSAPKIRPLADRIVVKPKDLEETTNGGIVLPGNAEKDKPMEGTVLAIGNGKYYEGKVIPLQVKVGDRILFGKYSGTNVKLDNKEFLVIREDDVMGVLE